MSAPAAKTVTVPTPPDPSTPGSAFIFVFPFGIERSADDIPPLLLQIANITCRLWAPHVNRADGASGELVDYERIPSAPEARTATQSIDRLVVHHATQEEANLAIATAMRVDVYGAESAEACRSVATDVIGRFLRLCRLWLRQWWINRGPDDVFGTRRISFEVHPSGSPASTSTRAEVVIRPRLRSEAILTNKHFQLVWAALALGGDSSLSATTLLDSVYFSAFGEQERAILDAAIACEALLREEAYKRLSEIEARQAVPSQPLKSIVKVTRKVFGRPFDNAAVIAGLERLQDARNALAHGNPREIQQLSEIGDPAALWKVQRAAFDLFRWAATVVPRAFPDPVLAFERVVEPTPKS